MGQGGGGAPSMGGGAGVMRREEKEDRRSWVERAAGVGCCAGTPGPEGVVVVVVVVRFGAAEVGKCLFLYLRSTRSSICEGCQNLSAGCAGWGAYPEGLAVMC